MIASHQTFIAGEKTIDDWKAVAPTLRHADAHAWRAVVDSFLWVRLKTRYFDPINTLTKSRRLAGEGFSIVAIQCSLIEFLESTVQGMSYRFLRGKQTCGKYEYSLSSKLFVNFLVTRAPFSAFFDQRTGRDFYEGVRCGLLHEARTKNGWRIWASNSTGQPVDVGGKIVYRDDFNDALLLFIETYRKELQGSPALQEAFIRKFDSLCD